MGLSPLPKTASEVPKWQMYVPTDERGDHHEGDDNRHRFGKRGVPGSRGGRAR